MKVFLISSNHRLTEILGGAFSQKVPKNIKFATTDIAAEEILDFQPDVILIDENEQGSNRVNEILEIARSLSNSCAVLLNLQNNEAIVLNSHRKTLQSMEDLLEAIQTDDFDLKEDAIAEARHKADFYSFFAYLFNQRPDANLVQRLRNLDVEALVELNVRADDKGDVQSGLKRISDFVGEIADQSDQKIAEVLAIDWTHLFRGLKPGYVPSPPYEGVYIEEDDLKGLQSVVNYYRKHGVEPTASVNNRPDYIGLELDFLGYVCEQQMEALKKGDSIEVNQWKEVENEFLENHLGKWIVIFCEQAISEAQTDFYRGVLYLMIETLGERCTA